MPKPQTFIFMGLPGSGKGTQVTLLQEYIKKQDPDTPQYALSTGEKFREFIKGDGYTHQKAREALTKGELMPEFLAVWMWGSMFVENLKGDEHMFVDGFPRIATEAEMFHSAMKFYEREKPYVLYLHLAKEEVCDRLRKRLEKEGRTDDVEETVEERFRWYDKHVVPAIDFFRDKDEYEFCAINGGLTIEGVHNEILKAIS